MWTIFNYPAFFGESPSDRKAERHTAQSAGRDARGHDVRDGTGQVSSRASFRAHATASSSTPQAGPPPLPGLPRASLPPARESKGDRPDAPDTPPSELPGTASRKRPRQVGDSGAPPMARPLDACEPRPVPAGPHRTRAEARLHGKAEATAASLNPFKAALAAREPQVGLWLSMADPYMAEVSATAGFDWLLVDGEHAPNDLRSTLATLQAVAPHRSQPVVRVVSGDMHLIKQMLDIGAHNLLVPMVDTAEQARALVQATRYPPQGTRGVASAVARASQWNLKAGYIDSADDEVCLLVQAETVKALANLEAICQVDGVHGVFIGPADLSASMGHRGRPDHPAVQAAIDGALRTIIASGKAAGTLTTDPTQARRYLDMGCTFVATGVDLLLFANAARKLAAQFVATGPEKAVAGKASAGD